MTSSYGCMLVLGCATIRPLCPFPIGANKSIILVERELLPFSVRRNFSSGNNGVRNSNGTLGRNGLRVGDINSP